MIQECLRRRCLKKAASHVETGLLPLSQLHSAVAFIQVEEPSFDDCKSALQAFFREKGIKSDIFFFDFRKIGKEERLTTSIATTVLRKDLNAYGRPSRVKTERMLAGEPDLFLSLLPGTGFPLQFMAVRSHARFKVGREQLPGNVFDLVLTDPAHRSLSQLEAFRSIVKLLETIR